jgi:protein TonB
MKKLIKAIIFISISLCIHLVLSKYVDASRIIHPLYQPVSVSLVTKEVLKEKIVQPNPPEKEKPPLKSKPKTEPEEKIKQEEEKPPDKKGEVCEDTQPVVKDHPVSPQVYDHEFVINQYHKKIIEIIRENLYYPNSARRRGMEGTVDLQFTIDESGRVCNINVNKTSGYAVLDKASVKTINNCIFPPPPDDFITLNIPITFKLIEDS